MSTLHRYVLLLFAAVLAALVSGCATTEIVTSWKDPDLGRVPFRKVLVVFQHADPAIRRVLEDEMARDVPNSVPAYQLFNDSEVRDIERVKARVRADGFDSAVIMRVVSVDREVSYRPGRIYGVPAYYGGFWGYWGYGWGTVYDPGYLRSDRIVTIATNVYGVQEDKLVWASQSETFNPQSLRGAIAEVVKVTSRATGEVLKARG
ncbi:MAG TPA: hypothetical protein VM073_03660 [Usitatibacter sp.]|nr:hypothetical protein [Usitatibacter sp.]